MGDPLDTQTASVFHSYCRHLGDRSGRSPKGPDSSGEAQATSTMAWFGRTVRRSASEPINPKLVVADLQRGVRVA